MVKKRRSKRTLEQNMEDMEEVDFNNVTDSEDEYTEGEKQLLENVRTKKSDETFDSDDEVYGLKDDSEDEEDNVEHDDEEDSMKSDIEGLEEDYGLPDERAWGKKKRTFYSTDYVDADYSTLTEKERILAEMEEQEAKKIQLRLAEQLDDADFGLEFIQSTEDDTEIKDDKDHIIKTDLSKLSTREKQTLVQKDSPEFPALVNDFKVCITEARNLLLPFLKLVEEGVCPQCPAVSFVKSKYQLVLNYCVNISFYLMLKAKRLPVNSHPVIKRLAQYRQLLNQLEEGQGNLLNELQDIIKAQKEGMPLYNTLNGSKIHNNKKKVVKMSEEIEKEQNSDISDSESKHTDELSLSENEDHIMEEPDAENDTLDNTSKQDEKRAITYEMAKNKGLTPHRKKEQRNPRVKHRNKYRKAKIRRRGAIREVRKETKRYSGEISGIKATVKKSIKLK